MRIGQCPICKGFYPISKNWEKLIICRECNELTARRVKSEYLKISERHYKTMAKSSTFQALIRKGWMLP